MEEFNPGFGSWVPSRVMQARMSSRVVSRSSLAVHRLRCNRRYSHSERIDFCSVRSSRLIQGTGPGTWLIWHRSDFSAVSSLLASRATGQNAKHQSQKHPSYQVARGIPNRSANADSKNYRSPKSLPLKRAHNGTYVRGITGVVEPCWAKVPSDAQA